MKWAHLPNAGGIYDQHPKLLDQWSVIFQERHAHEKKEQADRERKQRNKSATRARSARRQGRR